MKIIDLRVYPIRIPLHDVLVAAYGKRDSAEFLLIELETDTGLIGIGEAATIPIYGKEDPAGGEYIIKKFIKPMLLGKDPSQIAGIHRSLTQSFPGYQCVKSAVDIALYDLAGKCARLPIYKLLGGTGGSVPIIWLVSASQGSKGIEKAVKHVKEGFTAIKVKVGRDWQQEIGFLRELREEVGEQPEIRLDANGAWHWKAALRYIRQMEVLDISMLEQPVPGWDIEGLQELRNHSPVPIVADECAITLHDVYKIARDKAADCVNIKICRSGGFYPGIKMAAVAEAAGMPVVVGSMLEYGVGTLAGAHFASVVSSKGSPAEVIGPLIARDDIVIPQLRYEDGKIYLTDAPGLGVKLDKAKIQQYRKEI